MTTQAQTAADAIFEQHRELLFGLAYRMLGSVADAEDVVQDAYLRWRTADVAQIESPKAYLTTAATRLAIDRLRLLRRRREAYLGPWLPEPLITEDSPAVSRTELAESLSLAFLVMLESLQPVERAVFLLHEAFQYGHDEIAPIVEKSPENCRQILSRARKQLSQGAPRFEPQPDRQQALLEQFLATCQTGDLPALVGMLTEDVVFYSDGGGKASAARVPICGADKVARLLRGLARKSSPAVAAQFMKVNGQLALVRSEDGRTRDVTILETAGDGRICAIRVIRNPDKLRRIPPRERS
jgi:RNA polymerase sigma-70 factor (ECF subfamily)